MCKKRENEFIDLRVYDCIKKIRKENKVIYDSIYEIINILRCCEKQIEKRGTEKNNVYLLAMLMQLNKFFQSAILMFEHGLKDAGDSLARTCIELTIKIIELLKNKDFIKDYELESYFEMKYTTQLMIDNNIDDLVSIETLNKCLNYCDKKIGNKTRKNVKIKNLAIKNKLYREYVLYRLFCNYTHQSIDQINNIISSNDIMITIDGDFHYEKFEDSIAMLISIIMIVLPVLFDEYLKDVELKKRYNVFEIKVQNMFI